MKIHRRHRSVLKIGLWALGISLVFLIGVMRFPREYPGIGHLEAFYHTLRLFILENDLPTFPRSPLLIGITFFAPLLAVSALGTIVTYLVRISPVIRTRWQCGHILVCGLGRTGQLLAETFRAQGARVVGVDIGSLDAIAEWSMESAVPVIFGDFLSRSVLIRAGGRGARIIVFSSGDDLLNIEGAIRAFGDLHHLPGQRVIWTHVASENLARTARRIVRGTSRTQIGFFDTYRIAARKLVENHFTARQRRGVVAVSVIGFGKFGRDLVEALMEDRQADEGFTLRVIDVRDLRKEVQALARNLNSAGTIGFEQADIGDLVLSETPDSAFFICTDDDIGNLTGALGLTRSGPARHVYVRMTRWPLPGIADHVRQQSGITFININNLVVAGLPDLTTNPNSRITEIKLGYDSLEETEVTQ